MIHTTQQIVGGTFADDHLFLSVTPTRTPEGATFEPWTDTFAVGFKVTLPNGEVQYVYLNPSSDSDDGVTNVFLYWGVDGDPAMDASVTHLDLTPASH